MYVYELKLFYGGLFQNLPNPNNLKIFSDYEGASGICIAKIKGFLNYNMQEYYYCNAYYPNALLL
jgi:hypothetical protein